MQLAPMRYSKIEGTAVAVTVTSAQEAKAALKELRHKKRELKFLRTALVRRQRTSRAKQNTTGRRKKPSLFRRTMAGLGASIAWLFEIATVSREDRRQRDPIEIEKDLQYLDETLHNIEGCIVQLQGKLLAFSS